jgi:high frequency lysogenization protein
MTSITEKTLAIAGVFQAAALVNQIANKGIADEHDLSTAIRSILNLDPASTLEVFGNYENLRTGLYTLIAQLNNGQQRDLNVARYVISLLHLQSKLSKRQDMLETIATGVARAQEQANMFGLTHPNVLANLAGIYTDTISQLAPKIIVTGEKNSMGSSEHNYLANPANADRIRALLLAGMRSAVLWRQLGGSRWQILFKRKHIITEARRILDNEMGQLH